MCDGGRIGFNQGRDEDAPTLSEEGLLYLCCVYIYVCVCVCIYIYVYMYI